MLENRPSRFLLHEAAAVITGGRPLLSFIVGLLLTISPVKAGELEQFFYAPLDGGTVAELTAAPEFPERPFVVTPVNWFNTGLEGLTNASFHYGSWLRGYLEAPVTGDYVFYLSADDSAEFFLSTDHAPANQRLVARVAGPVPHAVYDRQYDQRSVPITLERGRQYYFEVLHKQSAGTDHVQVGWLRPDDVLERPIPLRYVQRFVPAGYAGPAVREPAVIAPWIALPPWSGPVLRAVENQRVILAPNVSALPPVSYQWFRNGALLADENLSSLDLGEVTGADHGDVFTLLVGTARGLALSDDWPLHVADDVVAPALVSATVAGMTDGFLLTFNEPVDPLTATNAANYSLSHGVTVTDVSFLYGTNLTTVVIRTTPFPSEGWLEVMVSQIRDLAQPPNVIAPGSTTRVSLADGRITLRYFGGVNGGEPILGASISDVTNIGGRFPHQPDQVTTSPELGVPPYFADYYLAQLVGYLVPPVTGDYRFVMASDDQGILYLSTDADPANKRAIAMDPLWNGWRSYTTADRRTLANTGNSAFIVNHFPDIGPNVRVNDSFNTVGWIHLEAGQRYYVEALMKEGGGGDNLDVTWQLPGGPAVVDGQAPISGEFLAQWRSPNQGAVAIVNQPAHGTAIENRPVIFTVDASGVDPHTYQWFHNGIPIVDADEPTYTFPARLADQGARYAVRVRNDFSEVWSHEAQLVVWADIAPPRMVRAYADQHFDKVTLRFDEPVIAATATNLANYSITRTDNGQPLIVQSARVEGFLHGGWTNVVLRTGPIESGVNYTVRTSGITDLSERANTTLPADAATFTGWVFSPGFALYEWWEIPPGRVTVEAVRERMTGPPAQTGYLTSFESPYNSAPFYLERISATFLPPASGRHDFYLSSDGTGELWLETDSPPGAMVRIAQEPSGAAARSWTGTVFGDGRLFEGENHTLGDHQPGLVMAAGEGRKLELLWSASQFGHGQATYSGPGEPVPLNGTFSRLTGPVIAAWANPDAMSIHITQQPQDAAVYSYLTATFEVTAEAIDWDGRPSSTHYQWLTNGVEVAGGTDRRLTLPALGCPDDPLTVQCRVYAPGKTALTREAVMHTISESHLWIYYVAGTPELNTVRVVFSGPVEQAGAETAANYQIEGLEVLSARLLPSGREVELTTARQVPGQTYSYYISGVTDRRRCPSYAIDPQGTFTAWTFQQGWVRRELWLNLAGFSLSDLTNQARFPDQPDRIDFLTAIESPQTEPNLENYGQRLSGFLQVTNTGDYLFAIAADDQAVFYLSTDENPANKRAVVAEPEWQNYRDWNSFDRRIGSSRNEFFPHITTLPVNQSANTVGAIPLVAGEHYYFEVLHKEGGGGDHVAVTMWPAGSPPRANDTPGINGARVWNYLPADEEIEIFLQPRDYVVRDGHPASFSVAAGSRHSPVQFQWERNGVAIQGATQSVLNLAAVTGWEDNALIRCRLTAPPLTIMSAPARLRVINSREFRAVPSLYDGLNLVWGDDGTPVLLQSTTNLFPAPEWITRNWSDQRDGLLHFFTYPKESYAPAQEFFRVVPAE